MVYSCPAASLLCPLHDAVWFVLHCYKSQPDSTRPSGLPGPHCKFLLASSRFLSISALVQGAAERHADEVFIRMAIGRAATS